MLTAARSLFVERGYSKTTMDAIAERAEVGVATVYSYFTNKEGVFAALARMDMTELKDEGEQVLANLPEEPVAAVQALLEVYNKVHNYVSYEVIRDFTSRAMEKGPLKETSAWINEWRIDQLSRALAHAQRGGRISPSLPVIDAARIICDLLDRHYDRMDSPETEEKAHLTLYKWVGLLFDNWRADT